MRGGYDFVGALLYIFDGLLLALLFSLVGSTLASHSRNDLGLVHAVSFTYRVECLYKFVIGI